MLNCLSPQQKAQCSALINEVTVLLVAAIQPTHPQHNEVNCLLDAERQTSMVLTLGMRLKS